MARYRDDGEVQIDNSTKVHFRNRFSTTYHDRSAQRWDTTEANPRLIAWYAWIGPEIPIEGSVDIQEPLKVEMAP
jgi:hypothetical protein